MNPQISMLETVVPNVIEHQQAWWMAARATVTHKPTELQLLL
ncbi:MULTISPECIES: hypothetical protein [Oscillatoriales]|uniref:Uncharacterized protein n=1 Tax=Phormidium nigroviride PCC 7112 TaxID=179408 RepID=K9VR26_9CYAN|nr:MULTISPECIES: hypothetical protein [Oscillatoriales]AFZ10523.1 hypothetical protein Osc7112_6366 [Oscillatoria nigro-viridis PCC 7112]